jgi:glycosyltransferase involved in cell wall biosynthesis
MSGADPRLAVVIPVFRHSILLSEALESVLDQQAPFGIRAIIVNDGCPHAETEAVALDYARVFPGRVTYLRKPNGGLSDARNHGIRHVLDHLPTVQAIYLLDADNRLRPDAMARAKAVLDEDPGLGWVYPNIDMFGLPFAGDYGGDYSLLIHSAMNICEAGSLIRRSVFEAGVLFDTSFKQGFEDWDFFLSAARAGFRGRNLESFGFLYRKRPESMLADSERDAPYIRGAMQQKHKPLFQPRAQAALEQAEAPRFAIWLADRREFLFTTDPNAEPRRMSLAEYDRLYWQSRIAPSRQGLPPFLTVTSEAAMEGLARAGLLHWALWKLESMVQDNIVAVLSVTAQTEDRIGITMHASGVGRQTDAAALMIAPRLFHEVMRDPSTDWISTLASAACQVPLSALEVRLPDVHPALDRLDPGRAPADKPVPGAVYEFLSLLRQLRSSPYHAAGAAEWDWRARDISWRSTPHEVLRRSFNGQVAFPRVPDGRRHVVMVLPIVEFGGVEKVALNMAQGLRAHGWVPHLVVAGADDAVSTPEWQDAFDSIAFLADPDFAAWGGGNRSYLGTEVPGWSEKGNHDKVLGLLYWADAVINLHGAAIAAAMGQLRRFGVRTVTSLHLSDLTAMKRPVGNTYLSLAYEHAYDIFAPCSHRLGDWCHAMGVPGEKVVPVPNAPSFPADPAALSAAQAARMARPDDAPLRVMYLGRLDAQKGLNRLTAVIRACRAEGLAVDWRVIGKAVLGGAGLDPDLGRMLEPPLTTAEELNAAFAWADVLVLLSEFEGLPLTILEAQRAGVVPVATDVGAVNEAVADGETGVLLALDGSVGGCIAALRRLSADREAFRRLSQGAFDSMRGHDWVAATLPLHERLTALATPTDPKPERP